MPITQQTTPLIDAKGHMVVPTVGTPSLSATHANISNPVVTGNDTRGQLVFNVITSTIGAGTLLTTVNFAQAYSSAPSVVLTNASNQTTATWYVTNVTTTGFTIVNSAGIAIGSNFKMNYVVIG
jgi:hypothetical protein